MKALYLSMAVAVAVAAALPAAAANDFLGPRVGVVGGWDDISVDLDSINFDESSSGATFGIITGYHFPLGRGAIIGIGTSTMFSNNDKTFTNGPDTIKIEAKRDLELHAKLGAIVSKAVLLYAKVGYANAKVKARGTVGGLAFEESASGDGLRLGVGAEILVGGPISLVAEYRYSDYSDNFSRNQIVAGLAFSF